MTPNKRKQQIREHQSSHKRALIKMSNTKKRPIAQFNPALYITRQLTEEDVLLIKEAFDYHEERKTGLLIPNDLKQALYQQNFYANKETIYSLIAEYDQQALGGLNFDAFIRIINSQPAYNQNTDDLKKTFKKYDKEHKGYINMDDIMIVARDLGQTMEESQLKQLFYKIDVKKQGKIYFEDFCKLMHHPDSLK